TVERGHDSGQDAKRFHHWVPASDARNIDEPPPSLGSASRALNGVHADAANAKTTSAVNARIVWSMVRYRSNQYGLVFSAAFSIPLPAAFTSAPAPAIVLQPAATTTSPAMTISAAILFSIVVLLFFVLRKSTYVDEMPGHRGSDRHRGAHEMGSPARTLAALEVAVRRRRATLARLEPVVVHRKAHRAARLAPFESRIAEHAVQSFTLGLCLHESRSRNDHRELHARCDTAAPRDCCRSAQILDPRICARADEHTVH